MDGIEGYSEFLALHKFQLEHSAVPSQYWHTIYRKTKNEIFDAGDSMQLMLIDYGEGEAGQVDPETGDKSPVFTLTVNREEGILGSDPAAVFLIDHAWTFTLDVARQRLMRHVDLAKRLCTISGCDATLPIEEMIEELFQSFWRYCHCYSVATTNQTDPEDRLPIWYIMDEVGSAVNHSDTPNFRIVPFMDAQSRMAYSLLYPLRDVCNGELITRDCAELVPLTSPERPVLLLPWRHTDFRSHSFEQTEPDVSYFTSGHVEEFYPSDEEEVAQAARAQALAVESRVDELRVFTEYDVLQENLTAEGFELVDTSEEADILWSTKHFQQFTELMRLNPERYINQFPFEYVLTVKDLLCVVARRRATDQHHDPTTLETYPQWLPTTYNLKTELPQFAAYFQERESRGLDNLWIVKPWNLARSLDMHITDNIDHIMRLPATGPKIAQKYSENPVLFWRDDIESKVKFDVRYVVLLKSVAPLEVYIYRKFFLRFANKDFSLDTFDDYEKHFTVMNYRGASDLRHLKCEDFKDEWQQQYEQYPWEEVENEICDMLSEIFECATSRPPPCGLANCPQSRALYAVDVLLKWSTDASGAPRIQPQLLEVNWTPDCRRACVYYPDFFNDCFRLLFRDVYNPEVFRLIHKPTNDSAYLADHH